MPIDPKNASVQDIVQQTGGDNKDATKVNPVIDALKTLQMFIATVKEQNPEMAKSQEDAFKTLVTSLQGSQQAGSDNQMPASDQGSSEGQTPPEGNMDYKGSSRRMTKPIPMNARPGAQQIM